MTPYRFVALFVVLAIACFAKYAATNDLIVEYIGVTALAGGLTCMVTGGQSGLVDIETDNPGVHLLVGLAFYAVAASVILGVYLMIRYMFAI